MALMLPGLLALSACSGGAGSAAPGDDTTGGASVGGVTVADGEVAVSADDLEFNAEVIEAPAGEPFTITLTNDDSVPHNISVYTEEGGDEIVHGDVIDGGQTATVNVPALDPGEYFFVCDLHPADMTGSVVVEG